MASPAILEGFHRSHGNRFGRLRFWQRFVLDFENEITRLGLVSDDAEKIVRNLLACQSAIGPQIPSEHGSRIELLRFVLLQHLPGHAFLGVAMNGGFTKTSRAGNVAHSDMTRELRIDGFDHVWRRGANAASFIWVAHEA